MQDYAERHVVVTGGTGALGAGVVGAVLERGGFAHVPVFSGAELEGYAHRAHPRFNAVLGVDLTSEAGAERFFAGLPALFASVHLAGGFRMAPLAETSLADLQHMLSMNAVTCFLSCREAVKAMRRTGGGGRIVNVTAKPALVPTAGLAAYAASKAAVLSLTVSLAEELAPEGIWVNAIAPSIMDTPANRRGMPDADFTRWPKVEEVARTIAHLASPENAVGRGAVVPVFGRS